MKVKFEEWVVMIVIIVIIIILLSPNKESFSNSSNFSMFSPRDMFGISESCYECDKKYGYGSGKPASEWCEKCGAPGRGNCWNGSWTGVVGD